MTRAIVEVRYQNSTILVISTKIAQNSKISAIVEGIVSVSAIVAIMAIVEMWHCQNVTIAKIVLNSKNSAIVKVLVSVSAIVAIMAIVEMWHLPKYY